MHLPAVLAHKISIDVGVAVFPCINAAVMPDRCLSCPVPALRDFAFIVWGSFQRKSRCFETWMLSLGKLLRKILFSACSNVMNETLSPEELQWYLGAKYRMLFGLVAGALFFF